MTDENKTIAARLTDLQFSYDGSRTMTFDCSVIKGSTTAIMGASGSGKSTLLSLIAGFEKPLSGVIELEGVDVTDTPPSKRPLSMVFQSNNLFAHLSVADNIGLGISPALRLSPDDRVRIDEALQAVGLPDYHERLPAELSGGERQRVALARVLVRKQPILLLDEAFASLGPGLREDMLDLVKALTEANGLTTIMVTHAPEDALRIAAHLIFIDDGKVALVGKTRDLLAKTTENPLIRAYLGQNRSA